MDVGEKKKPVSRLFQLAIKDAIQSRLSLVSPFRILMEKEEMEKRKTKCVESKIALQRTDMPQKSSSVSSDKCSLKIGKKTNSNTAKGLENENLSQFPNCQVRDTFTSHSDYKNDFSTNKRYTFHTEITCNLGDQQNGEVVWSPKPHKSSLLNDFECLWIPDENDSSSDISDKSISIDLSSPEWDKIESKSVSSRDSNSEASIDYDLPVFPLSVAETIPTQETLLKSYINGGLICERSNLTLGSSKNSPEFAFPTCETPALEFLQQSTVLNNFIPPPRVMSMKNSADNKEIPAPYMHDKTISRSCKSLNSSKCICDKLCNYGSEARLNNVNNENSSKFDPYLTLRHFESMLSENPSESFENTDETNFTCNYSLNYSHMNFPISKPHSVNSKMSGEFLEQPFKSHYFNYNPSGLLKHFPDFKPVI